MGSLGSAPVGREVFGGGVVDRVWCAMIRVWMAAILIGLLAAWGGGLGAVAAEPGGATVDAESPVNLRGEAGTWAAVVGQAFGGQAVTVVAGPTGDGWYLIEGGGQVGWLHGWFLVVGGSLGWDSPPMDWTGTGAGAAPETGLDGAAVAAAEPVADPAVAAAIGVGGESGGGGGAYVDTTLGLNVRAAPDEASGVVGVAAPGEAVTVTGEAVNGYVPVSSWTGAGWVWGDLLAYGGSPLGVGGEGSAPAAEWAPPQPGVEEAPAMGLPGGPLPVATTERWVDVNRSTQTVTLYEGGYPVASYWAAMGRDQSADGFLATAVGTHYVYEKYRDLSWTVWGNAWVRDWVGFDLARANGFHSYSMDWAGQVLPSGAGPTNGCVALDPGASAAVFDFVEIGTRVEVHW